MTFTEFNEIFQTPFLKPWENDYYEATFAEQTSTQEFLDHAYTSITGLTGLWFYVAGNMSYFIVPKGTVIPDEFALTVKPVTDIPEQPVEQPVETPE